MSVAAQFFHTCHCLFCMVGFQDGFRQANPAWETLLGYVPGKLLGRPFLDLAHPDDQPGLQAALDALANGTQASSHPVRCRHRDGSYREILWQFTVAPLDTGFYAVGLETTGCKSEAQREVALAWQEKHSILAEQCADLRLIHQEVSEEAETLRQNEAEYREILASLEEAVLIRDHLGGVRSFNARTEELFGSALNAADFDKFWQENEDADECVYRRFSSGNKGLIYLRKRGRVLRRPGESAPYARLLLLSDRSDYHQLEQRDADFHERFDLLMEHSNEALIDWDLRTGEVYCSPQWERLLGHSEQTLLHHQRELGIWRNRVHPADYPRVDSELRNFLEGKIRFYDNVHRLQKSDGTYEWVYNYAIALRDKQRKTVRLLSLFADVNSLRRAEEALQKINFLQRTQVQERREAPRARLALKIHVQNADNGEVLGYLGDISLGGLMFVSRDPIPLSQVLRLRIPMPSSEQAIEADAEVRWHRPDLKPNQYSNGCLFLRLPSRAMPLVEELADRLSFGE